MDASKPPSSYAVHPGQFGSPKGTEFIRPHSPAERAEAEAARTQHQVALMVRRVLRDRGTTQSELVLELGAGWRASKVSRILNGRAILSLADMHALLSFCALDLASFAVLAAEGRVPKRIRGEVIADFLEEQLRTVKVGSADTESGHPSTPTPPN